MQVLYLSYFLDPAHMLLAMSRMTAVKISTIHEELTEQCSAILYSYRRNCAAATVPTQVRPPAWFAG